MSLTHCYTTINIAYYSILKLHLGKFNDLASTPCLQADTEAGRSCTEVIQSCSEETNEILHHCFESVDWSIFKEYVANLDEYATVIPDFISKYAGECVPKETICVFPHLDEQ